MITCSLKDGNTALHIACINGHINVIRCLLSQGADMTSKNKDGSTPLDECQETIKDEIASVVSKCNPKQGEVLKQLLCSTPTCLICYHLVLENVSEWNIEYLNEEQVFEKQCYGFKFVIPPSSVEVGQKIKTEVKVVSPEESEIILPPNVEVVSCFYKVKTAGKFIRPINLYLQHNVELRSHKESKQLAFIKAKGPPPYKFELLPTEYDQVFSPYDNSGVVGISDFCLIAIIQKIKDVLFWPTSHYYMMAIFFKERMEFCWEIQAVVTKNYGPFLEVCRHYRKRTTTLYYHCIHVPLSILESEHRETF